MVHFFGLLFYVFFFFCFFSLGGGDLIPSKVCACLAVLYPFYYYQLIGIKILFYLIALVLPMRKKVEVELNLFFTTKLGSNLTKSCLPQLKLHVFF